MALGNYSSSVISPSVSPPVPYNNHSNAVTLAENDGIFENSSIRQFIDTPPTVYSNYSNTTIEEATMPPWKKTLNDVFAMSMAIVLVVLMLGMGSHVYWKEVLGHFWPPLPTIIGMCGQFVILPALAYGISVLFDMKPYVALGTLILSCSPGGAFSNFYTYWVHGDVALSLVMTTCSTLLSFGTMPLNLWIYSSNIVGADSEQIVVPYKNIFSVLGFVCVPVLVGMTIRHFNEAIANRTTQIASIIGYIMVAFQIASIVILAWDTLSTASWHIHVSVVILPMTGMVLAYLAAFVSRRSHKICRTIAIETASQNIPVAMGVIVLSFSDIEVRNQMLLYPSLYSVYMFIEIFMSAAFFRYYYYRKHKLRV